MDEQYCEQCHLEPVWRNGQTLCDTCRIAALEKELAGVKELLAEVWNQFAIEAEFASDPIGTTRKWAGGLSVLEDVAMALGIPQ